MMREGREREGREEVRGQKEWEGRDIGRHGEGSERRKGREN